MTAERRERAVFVIKDDPGIRELLEMCVGEMDLNIHVSSASDPIGAVEYLHKNSPPDLILLDLRYESEDLAGIESGLDVLKWIRGNKKFKNTSVIVVSADDRKDTKKRCEALGSNGFIAMPFDLKTVEDKIRSTLGFE